MYNCSIIDLLIYIGGGLMKEDHSNKNFNYSYVDMEEVASNVDEYIIPECQ